MRIIHGFQLFCNGRRLKIWYNPCIIRQYIHSKTAENHVLFSKKNLGNIICIVFGYASDYNDYPS